MRGPQPRSRLLPGVAALALVAVYVIVLLAAERQAVIIALLALAILAVLAAKRLGLLEDVGRSFAEREDMLGALAILAALAVAGWFYDNHFVLLLVNSVLLYAVATLGLNLQFGYAGVLNFAGASFFGIGAYTSSVLLVHTAVPHLLVLFIGGLLAALVGSLLVGRVERSWIGLNLDALRLDETAARCFGLDIARWKTTAFLLGNFLIGIAGALYGMLGGFVAPNNYTFADSLILVSILLLGGIGNPWGVLAATVIVILVPEKLQAIQEYRFLLYAGLVILVLLFRPEGLLPRPVRRYFPAWRP